MDEETKRRAREALAGAVAVAQFAQSEWVDDPEAVAAGFRVTTFDDAGIAPGPGNPPYLDGPGSWNPAFEATQAWRELGAAAPMTVDYRRSPEGNDTITVLIDTHDSSGTPLTVAIGLDDELGLFADGRTVEALGGRPPAAGAAGYDVERMLPRDAANLRRHGVDSDERDRVWQALNGVARTHAAAVLWHEDAGGARDLRPHEEVDRAAGRGRAAPAPAPAAAPEATARYRGLPQAAERTETVAR